MVTKEEWDGMSPEDQWAYCRATDYLCDAYEAVVKAIPECPVHGDLCTAHAIDWVNRALVLLRDPIGEGTHE